MKYRQIGNTDLQVSVLGLGCNNLGGRLDEAGSREVVNAALDLGITFLDTADSYGGIGGSERMLGEALGARRKDVVIATKFGWPLDTSGLRQGASRRYIFEAVEASLRRLKTDWIDLYQLHQFDPETPVEETLEALSDLVQQGKVRHVGCSNLTSEQIRHAAVAGPGGLRFASSQHHYNLLARDIERDVVPALQDLDMSLIPYSPLAAGLLSGKFQRGAPLPVGARITNMPKLAERYLNDENWQTIEDLVAFGAKRGRSLLDVAVAWLAGRSPVCSVIAGAMSAKQLEANARAVDWTLSPDEMAEVDRITTSTPVAG